MSVDWKLKIKAFLYQLPWGALCEQEPHDRKSIENLVEDNDFDAAQQANEIAFGLDVPPFVRQQKNLWNVWLEDPVLKHPLSGASYNLVEYLPKNQRDGLCGAAKRAVQETLQQVKKKYLGNSPTDDDYRKAFLALWRLLPDLVREEEQKQSGPKLGPLWDLLPADPRVPDHSIFDHASMASAVASALPKPAFLIFTIASAQDFVSTARRTQDFWMSSYLLSYLTWTAMRKIAEDHGPDSIITPGLRVQPLVDLWLTKKGVQGVREPSPDELMIASFPNIFMALVPESKATQIAEDGDLTKAIKEESDQIFNSVRSHVEKALTQADEFEKIVQDSVLEGIKGPNRRPYAQQVGKHFLQTMPKLAGDTAWKQIWDRQREDFLSAEIFWITYPWQPPSDGPAKVMEIYESLLQPVTNLHDEEAAAFAHFQPLFEYVQKHSANTVNIGIAYPLLSALAGRCLTARKNLRHFQQSESNSKIGEPEHKCSLCGIREALHASWVSNDPSDHYAELRIFWEVLSQIASSEIKLKGRIRRGERLCAVCLTKRLALEAYFVEKFEKAEVEIDYHIFPSTASVATAKFKERLLQQLEQSQELYQVLKTYVKTMREFLKNYDLFRFSAMFPRLRRRAEQLLQAHRYLDREVLLDGQGFLRLDGDWLYEESFDAEKIYREEGVKVNPQQLENAKIALKQLLEEAKRCQIPKPRRYYAVLYMDGDSMGEWVSGRRGPKLQEVLHPQALQMLRENSELEPLVGSPTTQTGVIRRLLGPALHRTFSNIQRDFARKIVQLVVERRYCGKLIYAGGDDVLAFVPVEDLMDVLRELRLLFTGDEFPHDKQDTKIKSGEGFVTLEKNGQKELLMMMGSAPMGDSEKRASASTGVVIAHHSHPFSHVIEEAQKALKEDAKKKFGDTKDAFAVHLLKRSGEPLEMRAQWFAKEVEDLPAILNGVARCISKGALSSKLAYDMSDEAAGLRGFSLDPYGKPVQVAEFKRLLYRHINKRKITREDEMLLYDQLPRLLQQMVDCEDETAWERSTKFWLLARFLAQES